MLLINSLDMTLNSKYRTEKLKAKDTETRKTQPKKNENLVLQKKNKKQFSLFLKGLIFIYLFIYLLEGESLTLNHISPI